MNRLLRMPQVLHLRGDTGKTKLYRDISDGVFTPAAKLGTASVWPEDEVSALNSAVISGFSPDQMRELVKKLMAARADRAQQLAA